MRVQVIDIQGGSTLDLCGPSANWWSTQVEIGMWIDLEPGDKITLKVGSMILLCEDGSALTLTGPATLENTVQGDSGVILKFIKGEIQYLKSSGAIQFLKEAAFAADDVWAGPVVWALKRYLRNRACAGASAERVIYANDPNRADHLTPLGGASPNQGAQSAR